MGSSAVVSDSLAGAVVPALVVAALVVAALAFAVLAGAGAGAWLATSPAAATCGVVWSPCWSWSPSEPAGSDCVTGADVVVDAGLSANAICAPARRRTAATTPFDMVMLNDLDRFHLVMDVIDRVPGLSSRAGRVRQLMDESRLRARAYTWQTGEDSPEIRDWTWPG